MTSKSCYELLELAPAASQDEIRRAFRRIVSRYHPDKVQHLGLEFQQIAAARTAEITQAYKALTSPSTRVVHDRDAEIVTRPPRETGVSDDRAEVAELIRRAALVRFRHALRLQFEACEETHAPGFDVSVFVPKTWRRDRWWVLGRLVPHLQAAAVTETWLMARRFTRPLSGSVCVVVMGQGMLPATERRSAAGNDALTVITVDIGTWQALAPVDAPSIVTSLVRQLQAA